MAKVKYYYQDKNGKKAWLLCFGGGKGWHYRRFIDGVVRETIFKTLQEALDASSVDGYIYKTNKEIDYVGFQ